MPRKEKTSELTPTKNKSLERWIWDAACTIHGAKDAGKYKDFILPLIFVKRLCDVFDDEINKIAKNVGSRAEAIKRIDADHSRVRFYLSLRAKDPETQDTWSVIRSLSDKIGEELTRIIREIAAQNSLLDGVIDTVDYNATTRGQREIDDHRLSNLIEAISQKRLGLQDVEPDIIGRSYEYLIRKFAEGSGQSAGEFYTPAEVGMVMAHIMDPEPGMEIYDPCCGSAGLLIKCELALKEKQDQLNHKTFAPLRLYGQEFTTTSWAMAKMNTIIHDMEGDIELGDTFNNPKFKDATGHGIKKFDRVVANPMWNQTDFNEEMYTNDPYHRFVAGNPGGKADWGWMQHILASLKDDGRAAVVLDTGAVSRSGAQYKKEVDCRKWFIENDLIEGVIYLPANLFYNTPAEGVIIILNKKKPLQFKEKIFLVNAGNEFVKGDPKNYFNEEQIRRIFDIYSTKKEIKNFSVFLDKNKVIESGYNISPARHVSLGVLNNFESPESIFTTLRAREEEKNTVVVKLNEIFGALSSDCSISGEKQSWKKIRLDECFYIEQGKQVSKQNRRGDNQRPFLRTANVYWGHLDLRVLDKMNFSEKEEVKYSLQKGDLLVCEGGDVGRTAVWNNEIENCYFQNHIHRLRKKISNIDEMYVLYFLQYSFVYTSRYLGRANKTTIPNLSKSRLGELEILLPPIEAQTEIVKILSSIENINTSLRMELSLYETLFKTMLDKLLSENKD